MGLFPLFPSTRPPDLTSSFPADPNAPTTPPSDRLWLRSELMGTQVITRDSGRRLGVVGEVVVDIDRREVIALGLRDNPLTRFLPGLPRWMPLDRIRQVGDVILVDSADSLAETFDPERYSKVINCQVVSESGVQLGRVLGFSFDIETGELTTLVIGALGVPLLGEGVLSTWELPVAEIVSSGTDRIVVYEGAEEKLRQLGTGLLEKLGIGGAGWEQEERERYRSTLVPAENQLPAGEVAAVEQRRLQPASARSFEPRSELEYVELEERREREPLRQRRYLDEDLPERSGRGDWSERRQPGWEAAEPPDREGEGGWGERRRQDREAPQDRWSDAEASRRGEPAAGERSSLPPSEVAPPRQRRDRPQDWQDEPAGWQDAPRERPLEADRAAAWPRQRDRSEARWQDADDAGRESGSRERDDLGDPGARRRPLDAGGRREPLANGPAAEAPSRMPAGRSEQPVDVEPEVLDDPW